MAWESFLMDKMIGLGCFVAATAFFFAGVAASATSFPLSTVLLILAAASVCVSLWFIRKK